MTDPTPIPCPWCGCEALAVGVDVDRDGTHSWRVECQADEKGADHFCAVGPERREKADAIAAWNAVAATRVAGRVAAAAEAIIDAAIGWRAALAEGRNADAGGHWWTLCSLAERAEAAERVAKAALVWRVAEERWDAASADERDPDDPGGVVVGLTLAEQQFDLAVIAYRQHKEADDE